MNTTHEPQRHPGEALLNDHVDGVLSAADRAEVERHLGACASCRAEVQGLRALIGQAAELADVPPARDLWPAVRNAAVPQRTGRAWWGALAASVLLLTATAVVAVVLRGGVAPTPADGFSRADARSDGGSLADLRQAEREYREASARLLELLDERREGLSPETLAVVEENVAIIDRAIDEASLALQSETPATGHAQVLTALYQKKLQLLWKISRLPS